MNAALKELSWPVSLALKPLPTTRCKQPWGIHARRILAVLSGAAQAGQRVIDVFDLAACLREVSDGFRPARVRSDLQNFCETRLAVERLDALELQLRNDFIQAPKLPLERRILTYRRCCMVWDIYAWLTLHSTTPADALASWELLKKTFGGGYSKMTTFRHVFKANLQAAPDILPANVELRQDGLLLRPAPRSIRQWVERTRWRR